MAEQHVAQRTGPRLCLTELVFVIVVSVALADPHTWGQNVSMAMQRLFQEF
ncbi:hypothetical protein CAN33_0018290 [Aspergillus niger]|uniref:Uncharacterized protein n=1 Tax=Aspergillus niger TaxID=5061 RepID=A0A505I9B9_ASPNG|nr:hypothetical protein CAN33_0018290 [Aspergillus niger]